MVLSSCRKDIKPEPIITTPYVIEYPELISNYLPEIKAPLDNPTTKEGVDLGRLLFFDVRLSEGNVQSCGSCHLPENSFSDISAFCKV